MATDQYVRASSVRGLSTDLSTDHTPTDTYWSIRTDQSVTEKRR
jgi:hypothetical protein